MKNLFPSLWFSQQHLLCEDGGGGGGVDEEEQCAALLRVLGEPAELPSHLLRGP